MDDVEIFRAIACFDAEPRATLAPVPDGPGVFDWTLVRRSAEELASTLTLQRAQAELQRGASERSRKLRSEIRANSADLEVDDLEAVVERLLQVRVEDYDGRSGWHPFDDARRSLRRAETEGERYDAVVELARRGLELFGSPIEEPGADPVGEVQAESTSAHRLRGARRRSARSGAVDRAAADRSATVDTRGSGSCSFASPGQAGQAGQADILVSPAADYALLVVGACVGADHPSGRCVDWRRADPQLVPDQPCWGSSGVASEHQKTALSPGCSVMGAAGFEPATSRV